jgi:flagellar basal-body rod protein FlgF/flagellar basal-body rod protein FlgG
MEVLSHNLANVNTTGFKPQLAILQARENEANVQGYSQPGSGTLDDLSGGATAQQTQTHFTQGPIEPTGRDTDFALSNTEAFFVVQRGDEQLLTRAGNFLFDSKGGLVTPNGDAVLSGNGNPIKIDPELPYRVGSGGTIQQSGESQSLQLTRPAQLGDLSRVGDNFYRPLSDTTQLGPGERPVINAHLEHSAVKPTSAMMELIETSRVYEANLKMIQHQDQSLGSLVGRLLKA